MQTDLNLTSSYIPNSYYAFVITACNMALCVLIPAQATKFASSWHFNNRTVDICRFINHLEAITIAILNQTLVQNRCNSSIMKNNKLLSLFMVAYNLHQNQY